jgi:hypothetical protein
MATTSNPALPYLEEVVDYYKDKKFDNDFKRHLLENEDKFDEFDIYTDFTYVKLNENHYSLAYDDNEYDILYCSYKQARKTLLRKVINDEELYYYSPTFLFNNIIEGKVKHITCEDVEVVCEKEYQVENCPICFETITKANDTIRCGHQFCKSCLDKYLEHNDKCPMCRDEVAYVGIQNTETEEPYTLEDIEEMCDNGYNELYDIIDVVAVVDDAIITDGLCHLLHYDNETDELDGKVMYIREN